jgi:DNA-binding NtrC family response regulator
VEYLTKPVDIEELTRTIKEAAQVRAASLTGKGDQYKIPPGTEIQVLLVDDEEELLASLGSVLKRRKMQIQTALSGDAALEILRQSLIDVIVLNVKMPGMSGLELLKQIKRDFIGIEVILLTGHPNVGNALEGVKLGAFDYIEKPPDVDELARVIHRAFEHRQEFLAQRQQDTLRGVLEKFPD